MKILPSKAQWRRWSFPSKATVVGAYATVAGLVLYVGMSAVKTIFSLSSPENTMTSEQSYIMTEHQFRKWCENIPSAFETQREKKIYDLERRGMLDTGIGLEERVGFLKEFRRSMDQTIDSFRLEYAIQGGDTLALSFASPKKLPGGDFSRLLIKLYPDYQWYIRQERVDTL